MARGRVQILPAGDNPVSQAQAAVAELRRLSGLVPDADWDWSTCAVIAREWSYLDPVRGLCELEDIPVQLASEEFTGVWHLRETRALVNWLRGRDSRLVTSSDTEDWLASRAPNPWIELLHEAMAEYVLETGGAETPVDSFIEWLAEWGREIRRRQRGLLLLTAHRAKGLEFDHVVVLDGGWDRASEGEDAAAPVLRGHDPCQTDPHVDAFPREAPVPGCFVEHCIGPAPTRARGADTPRAGAEPALSAAQLARRVSEIRRLPGPEHPVHAAISALSPVDPLQARMAADRWELLDQSGTVVGQLARGFKAASGVRRAFATEIAIVEWDRERSDPDYRNGLRCENWEVVVPEIVFEPVA